MLNLFISLIAIEAFLADTFNRCLHSPLIHHPNQPLLHAIIFLVEMAVTLRLIAKFNSYYKEKPGTYSHPILDRYSQCADGYLLVLTTMVTNAVCPFLTHHTEIILTRILL